MHFQRGNALFLILIAVALFAALSYAITQSGRGGGSISKEQAKIYAAQIIQYVGEIQTGIQRMELGGTAYADIAYATPGTGDENGGFGSANGGADFCAAGATCLFAAEGGGIALPSLPQGAYDMDIIGNYGSAYFSGPTSFNGMTISSHNSAGDGGSCYSWNNAGTGKCDDALIFMPIKKEVCEAINKGLGIDGIPHIRVNADWSNNHAECEDRNDGGGYEFVVILRTDTGN